MARTGSPSAEQSPATDRSGEASSRPARIGRFLVLEVLPKGSRGAVYLAEDPELGRKVTIKTLSARSPKASEILSQAHAVGKLRHPHILRVFEVGEHLGVPYVVYEHVPGSSVKTLLAEKGSIPIYQGINWMLEILDAVDHAHAQGIIHRDLNPAKVQIGEDDRARVMDFGISAVALQKRSHGGVSGNVNYLAPELLDGGSPSPASDIYALGLVLYEMATGRPAEPPDDTVPATRQVGHQPIEPPSGIRPDLGPEFDRVVLRALERKPHHRYANAKEMRDALRAYLHDSPEPAPGTRAPRSTLSFLLRRMRRRTDFPAVAKHVAAINKMTGSAGEASVSELANVILNDYALTTKLLRLVNSSFYGQYGGHISTVSRAVVVLGFTQVRNAALSLLLFEHLTNQPQAIELRELTGRAFLSGNIGRRIASQLRLPEPERAYICAMYHTLGEYLAIYYFPEEYVEILSAMHHKGLGEAVASRSVLGLSFEALGLGVAREWCLPDDILASMRRPPPGPVGVPENDGQALRYIAAFANGLTESFAGTTHTSVETDLTRLKRRFEAYIAVDDETIATILNSALGDLAKFAGTLGVNLKASEFFQNAVRWLSPEETPASQQDPNAGEEEPKEASPARQTSASDPETTLLSGIQDVTQALLCNYDVNDILVMVLETIYRGLGFTRVLLCIRDARKGLMVARFGLGKDVDSIAQRFRFPLSGQGDCFSRALREQKDQVRGPESDPPTDAPDWYRSLVNATGFALCPIVVNGISLGLIYADRDEAGRAIDENDLNYLNALRNQAALAIKQRS